jgi:hypothetical protein
VEQNLAGTCKYSETNPVNFTLIHAGKVEELLYRPPGGNDSCGHCTLQYCGIFSISTNTGSNSLYPFVSNAEITVIQQLQSLEQYPNPKAKRNNPFTERIIAGVGLF